MGTVLTQTLGDRLRKSRKAAGFTQAQMATYLEVSRPRVVAWEADDSDIPATKLLAWAQIVDLTPNDLLTARKSAASPHPGGRPRTPAGLSFDFVAIDVPSHC